MLHVKMCLYIHFCVRMHIKIAQQYNSIMCILLPYLIVWFSVSVSVQEAQSVSETESLPALQMLHKEHDNNDSLIKRLLSKMLKPTCMCT